ncbi:MAG: ABC transporter permease, partial [Planctomycetota bacterium]
MDVRRPLALPLLVPALVAALFLAAPLVGLALRAPWSTVLERATSDPLLAALRLSLVTSTWSAALAFVLGVPLAAWLASGRSPARTLVRILVTLPLVLPPVVAGVALLLAFGRAGLLGGSIELLFGAALPFTTLGVVVAQTYVALPFLVLAAEAGLRGVDRDVEDAARTLGAGPWRVFRTVTLPLARPALGAGLLVAWARALGEFGATITFAGSLEGTTRTLPLAVYAALEREPDAAIALSLVLVAVSALVLFL